MGYAMPPFDFYFNDQPNICFWSTIFQHQGSIIGPKPNRCTRLCIHPVVNIYLSQYKVSVIQLTFIHYFVESFNCIPSICVCVCVYMLSNFGTSHLYVALRWTFCSNVKLHSKTHKRVMMIGIKCPLHSLYGNSQRAIKFLANEQYTQCHQFFMFYSGDVQINNKMSSYFSSIYLEFSRSSKYNTHTHTSLQVLPLL